MTRDKAWDAFVAAAKEWERHLDQWDKIKFKTDFGMCYVSIGREDPYPDSFDEVSSVETS
jgi:hypothetical protein